MAQALEVGDLTLDLLTREAQINGRDVPLSAREFALLAYLMRHPGQVLSRQQILNGVWGYTFDPRSNLVDVYIGYLRRKLGRTVTRPIETVRGMGYRLVARASGMRPRLPIRTTVRADERGAGRRRAGRRVC